MTGPLPIVSENTEKSVAGGMYQGLFSYEKSSIVTDADFQMDLRMTGQINNVPANFANSVHFLVCP